MFRQILIAYVFFAILSFVMYLPKIVQFCYAFKKPPHKKATGLRKIGLVIPALDESKVIGDLFDSIEKQDYDRAYFDVNVIVKDPTDPTVAMAKALGYNVFIVPNQTCKGEALDGCFKQIPQESFDGYAAFVIIDADAVPEIAGQYHVRADQLAAEHVWVSQPDLEGEYVRALGAERTLQALEHSGAFRASELKALCTARANGALDCESVAAFCRVRTNKTRAVIALLPHITAKVARRIESVDLMLNAVTRNR